MGLQTVDKTCDGQCKFFMKLQKGNAESAHTGKAKRELVSCITGFCSVHFIAKINVNNFQHAQGAETAEL
jgi:hypothetical protein